MRRELAPLVRLAWPLALSQMALVSLGIVDVAVIGRLSTFELAGASIGRQVAFFWIGIALGVGTSLEGLLSRARGAGDHTLAASTLRAGTRATVLSAVPPILCAILTTYALPLLGVDHGVSERARAFVIGQAPGLVFFVVFVAQKSYLSAYARTWGVLLVAFVANVVNFFACNLFIRGDSVLVAHGLPAVGAPALGALGAGLASSVASLVLMLGSSMLIRSAKLVERNAPVGSVAEVLRFGLPVGLQFTAEIGVFSLAGVLSGRFGESVAAAHQIALSLASFTFMGTIGISGATSVRVGLAAGEGRSPRRAGIAGIAIGATYMCFTGITFAAAPSFFVGLFSSEPTVHAMGAKLLLIAAAFQLFDGVQGVASGALRGVVDVRFAFITNVVAHWFVGLPVALYLGIHLNWGAVGLWWGLTLGLAVVAVVLLARFVLVTREPRAPLAA